MKFLIYLILLSHKDTSFIYSKPLNKIYYLNYETKPTDFKDLNGEFYYYDEIYFYDTGYKFIDKKTNDSLINEGYSPIEAINQNRAYKKYLHGVYKSYN